MLLSIHNYLFLLQTPSRRWASCLNTLRNRCASRTSANSWSNSSVVGGVLFRKYESRRLTNATAAKMTEVNTEAMVLDVNGQPVSIPFDHTLTDSEDAHRTMVAMLRAMPAAEESGES